ncbi:EpsG family protein [Photobacterium jeanii]|nr:EpsG family protein [Photobacterium jeanii]
MLLVLIFYIYTLVCFRGNIDRDYQNYLNIHSYLTNALDYNVEYSFKIISNLVNMFSLNPIAIFIVYGAIGCTLKLIAIYRYSSGSSVLFCTAFLVYSCGYLFLHEMTQIRIGVASGFFLIALIEFANNNRFRSFLLVALASLFHMSALLGLVIFLYRENKITPKELIIYTAIYLGSLILVVFNLSSLGLSWLSYVPIDFVQIKVQHYFSDGVERVINVLNIQFFVYSSVCFLALFFSDRLQEISRVSPIAIRVFYLSIISKLLLSSTPILGFRISEFFAVTEIYLIPLLLYLFRPKSLSVLIPVLIALLSFVNFIYVQEVLKPYEYFTYSGTL